jgi:hypothetical protein
MLASPFASFMVGSQLREIAGSLMTWVTLVATFVSLPIFMVGSITARVREEAAGICRRAFLRDVPGDAPADLKDVWRQGWITADGRPLSSELCETDARSMAARERALWWVPSALAIAIAVGVMIDPNKLTGATTIILLLMAIKVIFDKHPGKQRSQELNAQAGVEGVAFAEAGGLAWSVRFEQARQRQIREAIQEEQKDSRQSVVLGTSTGLLAARGDFFAPSADLPFCASPRDLETHILALGGTGAGKTSGILRPIAYQVGAWSDTGMVILDGKGALPNELRTIPNMRVIDPANQLVSLVGGLDPVTAVDTIVNVFSKGNEKGDRFFIDSAAILLRQSAVLARAMGGSWWTLAGIARIATRDSDRDTVIGEIPEDRIMGDIALLDAFMYMGREWSNMDERVRSNIVATARSWLSTITASPELLRWAETEEKDETVDVSSVLRGGRIGLLVPAHRYGRAGAVVTALLKARIYSGIKARADRGMLHGETPVVFIIDEVQEVATDEDATMLAIGRSLRLAVVAATQTVEGVVEKLGEQVSRKWLAIYGGVIALPGRSTQTDLFISERCGMSWRASIDQVNGMSLRTAVQAEMVSGALAAGRTQPTALRFSDVPKLGAPGLPKWMHNMAQMWQSLRTGMAQEASKGVPGSSLGVRPIAQAGEISSLLSEPDTALAVITRARVLRRDVIRLKPMYV